MPQIQVFRCPSCGASLSYEGGPETTITCQFCGTNVVVPEELRAKAGPPPSAPVESMPPLAPPAGPALPPDQAALLSILGQIASHAASAHPERAGRIAAVMSALEQMSAQGTIYPGVAGAGPDVQQALMAAVEQLARSGQKIEAIKVYRLLTHAGLKEAKDAVDAMAAGGAPAPMPMAPPAAQGAMAQVEQLARGGRKIEAIKLYRQLTNVGLREAKDAVEAMASGGGPQYAPPMAAPAPSPAPAAGRQRRARRGGGLGCLVNLAILAAAAYFVFLYLPIRISGSYALALSTARSDARVVRALGEPVDADWWILVSPWQCQHTCRFEYTLNLRGSEGSGQVDVVAVSQSGGDFFASSGWELIGADFTGEGQTIDLLRNSSLTTQTTAATAAPSPTPVPMATRERATPAPDFQATAQAMPNALSDWARVSPASSAAPFNHWPSGLTQDQAIAVTTTVQGKNYLLTVFPKHSSSYMNFFSQDAKPLTDFEATVDVAFNKGDRGNTYAYGLVFRRVEDDYGFFGLQNDGQYRLLLVKQTGIYQQIVNKVTSVSLGAGMANVLEVRNVGADFVFLVNGVPVWGLHEDLPAGQVGLGVDIGTHGQTAQVQFSNFEVRAPGK